MDPPRKTGRSSELNNTANAGRIVRGRNGRKILPAFLLTIFVAALAIAAIPQKKKECRNQFGADQEKEVLKKPLGRYGRKIVKGEASSRPVCRSQSAAPVIRGIAHPLIRRRTDHRTPAEPSAAEFSGLMFTAAIADGRAHAPRGIVLTEAKVKRDRFRAAPQNGRRRKIFSPFKDLHSAERKRKRTPLPTGEVRPSEHDNDF